MAAGPAFKTKIAPTIGVTVPAEEHPVSSPVRVASERTQHRLVGQGDPNAGISPPATKAEDENDMLRPAILALVRQVLTVMGTALVAKGYVEAIDLEPVIGALLTLGSVVWSIADKRGRRV